MNSVLLNTVLLFVCMSMGVTIIVLLLVLVRRLADARKEGVKLYDEAMDLFRLTRDMATSARDNRVETTHAAEVLKEKIDAVPEKTARKIAEKLPESRDDWRGHEGKTP